MNKKIKNQTGGSMKSSKLAFIVFTLLVSTCLSADGVEPVGSGTEADPYQVETLDNLLWISTNSGSWSSYFEQTADIDAAVTSGWNGGAGFSPFAIMLRTLPALTTDRCIA